MESSPARTESLGRNALADQKSKHLQNITLPYYQRLRSAATNDVQTLLMFSVNQLRSTMLYLALSLSVSLARNNDDNVTITKIEAITATLR